MADEVEQPVFSGLTRFLRHYPKGTKIFDQGQAGKTMFFIHDGRVRITKVTPTREQPLAVLEPGSFFGEMAVVSGEPRSARAETLSECALLEIDRQTLEEFLGAYPQVANRMIATLAERLRNTDELVERLLTGDPMKQVVDAIVSSAAPAKEDPPYIRDVQALMVKSGTDPTLLKWVLARLKQARFISVDDNGVRVGQFERLKQYQNFLNMQQEILRGERTRL